MVESCSKNGKVESIRQRVFLLLDENPGFTARTICFKADISYSTYRNYVYKLKCERKSYRQNERGSQCSNVHAWFGNCFVPNSVSRDVAVEVGWDKTRAKNKWLLWRDKVGRMMWFENGRVNVYVRSPANLGRAKSLVCNGFFNTGLIFEGRILDEVFKTFKFGGAHFVFDAGEPLPKMTINAFGRSHGIIIKTGDKSHPRGVEVVSNCPDWAERNELLLERLADLFDGGQPQRNSLRRPDYVV